MGQLKKDSTNCNSCISRRKIGLCNCSSHCTNHKFTSHGDMIKMKRAYDEKMKKEKEKIDMNRPKVLRI